MCLSVCVCAEERVQCMFVCVMVCMYVCLGVHACVRERERDSSLCVCMLKREHCCGECVKQRGFHRHIFEPSRLTA